MQLYYLSRLFNHSCASFLTGKGNLLLFWQLLLIKLLLLKLVYVFLLPKISVLKPRRSAKLSGLETGAKKGLSTFIGVSNGLSLFSSDYLFSIIKLLVNLILAGELNIYLFDMSYAAPLLIVFEGYFGFGYSFDFF